jgi:hypothetical protein
MSPIWALTPKQIDLLTVGRNVTLTFLFWIRSWVSLYLMEKRKILSLSEIEFWLPARN